jgi:hypothetical protein
MGRFRRLTALPAVERLLRQVCSPLGVITNCLAVDQWSARALFERTPEKYASQYPRGSATSCADRPVSTSNCFARSIRRRATTNPVPPSRSASETGAQNNPRCTPTGAQRVPGENS